MAKQANQYDKIFKENIEAVIPNLIKNILGIMAVSSEELPDVIQHTKERKPDVLKKVTDSQGTIFVLQIEFQLADEPEMVYRMAEYHIMLARKYTLPIRQFVLFLGSGAPQMAVKYECDQMRYEFPLIVFKEIDYRFFLLSGQPEEVVLGILADFKEESTDKAIKQIIQRIEETSKGDFSLRRHLNQLRVLARLRNLEQNLKEIVVDSIAKFFSKEKDVYYLVGKETEQVKFVTNLLTQTDFSDQRIAQVADVSIAFVNKVKQKLARDQS